MNIESILEKAELFNKLVIKNGFLRDLNDYISFISHGQNRSLYLLKDVTDKIIIKFEEFDNNLLDEELSLILKKTTPFTNDKSRIKKLIENNNNNEIDVNMFFDSLNTILSQLVNLINENNSEIQSIITNFGLYRTKTLSYEQKDENVVLSLVFNDLKSISTIKGFQEVLKKWDKILRLYYQLLKSDTPSEIELESVQNGCIEVIFNFNLDVALSLTDVITHGMDLLVGYFLMKDAKPKISKFMNKTRRLKELEEQEEKVFLEDLNEELYSFILEEHKKALEKDSNINQVSIEQIAKEITSVIFEHIINGNKLKLLTKIEIKNENDEEDTIIDKQEELREHTAILQEKLKYHKNEIANLLEYLDLPKYS